MLKKIEQIKTYYKLGLPSCLYAAQYKYLKQKLFYKQKNRQSDSQKIGKPAVPGLSDIISMEQPFSLYFHKSQVLSSVDWHYDYVNNISFTAKKHWSEIDWFDNDGIDIKNIWELSRFYWFPQMLYRAKRNGNTELSKIAFSHVCSWWAQNTPYNGVNWMCGQEASIRVLNFLIGIEMCPDTLQAEMTKDFLCMHCDRILLTMNYAKSQKNNHVVSEAVGLLTAGLWLKSNCENDIKSNEYLESSVSLLNWSLKNLVLNDGSFSQYSTNYHRLVLDLCSICFYFCVKYNYTISNIWLDQYNLLLSWLEYFVDRDSFKPVNMGSNDGAMLLNMGNVDYNDFSYSLTVAMKILNIITSDSKSSNLFEIINYSLENKQSYFKSKCIDKSKQFADGGFVRLSSIDSWAMFHYPVFKFRPSQCDIFHFDLWVKGVNVLLDSGTYSYNASDEYQNYFKSVVAHNTVQLDGLEQMESMSRFLYLNWPKARNVKVEKDGQGNISDFSCCYKHFSGAVHHRRITVLADKWIITDTMANIKARADLYWHLPDLDWILKNTTCENDLIKLNVSSDRPNASFTMQDCWVSNHYQKKSMAKRIQVSVCGFKTCVFVTTVTIK